jgi:hypothetical protein
LLLAEVAVVVMDKQAVAVQEVQFKLAHIQ